MRYCQTVAKGPPVDNIHYKLLL